jgi:hypothetical protein
MAPIFSEQNSKVEEFWTNSRIPGQKCRNGRKSVCAFSSGFHLILPEDIVVILTGKGCCSNPDPGLISGFEKGNRYR